MQARWTARGEVIRKARSKRWRGAKEFAKATGLSASLIDDIENGRRGNFRQSTITAIETTLGWAAGSFERVGEGRKPILQPDQGLSRLIALWPSLSPDVQRVLVTLAETVLEPRD